MRTSSCLAKPCDCVTDSRPYALELDDGTVIRGHTVILATGARYRRLPLPDIARFEGAGVHYAATAIEAALCEGEEAIVVGGGNSAGQAAVFLSRHAAHVHVLIRGAGLASTMSDYLVSRIKAAPERITLHPHTEVTALIGDRHVEAVTWRNRITGKSETPSIPNAFLMLGAEPNTEWLNSTVSLDDKGFVLTGESVGPEEPGGSYALADPLVTSCPGVFAVGDVRSRIPQTGRFSRRRRCGRRGLGTPGDGRQARRCFTTLHRTIDGNQYARNILTRSCRYRFGRRGRIT